jgi:hypothetical protein
MTVGRPVIALFGCVAALGISCGAWAQTKTKTSPASEYAQEIAAAKRAGFPVSAKDLQAPLPPPEQNAASLYEQLRHLFETKPLSEADKIAGRGVGRRMPPPEQMEKIRRALADRKDVLDLIYQAASRPKCVFKHDYSNPANELFREFATMREAARWLSAENALLLYEKKPLEAIRAQALGFRIARHAASEPILIS